MATGDVSPDDAATTATTTTTTTPTATTDESPESPDPSLEPTNHSTDEVVVLEEEEKSEAREKEKDLTPYGLPCVRELLRFLVSIISTEDGLVLSL